MSQTIQLIVCDIEGCISPPNRGIADPLELEPLARYCAGVREGNGQPPLVLCTGRQIPYAECIAQLIGAFFPGFPSVVENGAFLYDVARNDITPLPSLTPEHQEILAEVRRHTDALIRRYDARKEYGKEACISLNPPPNQSIEQWFETVHDSLQKWHEVLNICHSASAVDITPQGIDKAAGVRELSARLDIPFEAMLGVGDTRGDWPMLKLVGTPTGPANATNDVQQIAQYIASRPGPLGVAEIIQKYTGSQLLPEEHYAT